MSHDEAEAAGAVPASGVSMPEAFADEMRLLTTPPPDVSLEEAARILEDGYGLCGRLQLLAGERDRNFLLETEAGWKGVLKVYSRVDAPEMRDFQHGALLHVARSGHSGLVPELVPTRDGEAELLFAGRDGDHWVILLSCLPGICPAATPHTPLLRRNLGRAIGELHVALADYRHACEDRVLLWDHMQVLRMRHFAPDIADAAHRVWLTAFLDRFEHVVRPQALALPRQVIHNDLSTSNVLVDAEATDRITGIIDFGDIVRAPRINELAVAASYFLTGDGDLVSEMADLIEGYETVQPLLDAEVALLPDLIQARLATRILIYQWRAALFPDNRGYILRNSEGAWRMIDRMKQSPARAMRDALLARRSNVGSPLWI